MVNEATRKARWIVWLSAVVWCGLIFGTSSTVVLSDRFFAWIASHILTDAEMFRRFRVFWGLSWFIIVKGWHATEFAILFTLARAVLDRFRGSRPRQNSLVALAFCFLFAMSDEYHQAFIPGRRGTWSDVAIDCLGASFAALISQARQSSWGRTLSFGFFNKRQG